MTRAKNLSSFPGCQSATETEVRKRAVEVVAMLGDEIQAVKHVSKPRSGLVSGTTYALFSAAVIALVCSALGFGTGVANAANNAEALREWTEVQRKPAIDFRPRRSGALFGAMALGGLAVGLGCFAVAIARRRNETDRPGFSIGTEPETDFPTADAPAPCFPMVAPVGDDFVFHYSPEWQGEVLLDGGRVAVSDLYGAGLATPSAIVPGAMQIAIPQNGRLWVRLGMATYWVSSVPAARKHPVPLVSVESSVLAYFAGTAVAILSCLGLLSLRQPPLSTLSFEWMSGDDGLVHVSTSASEDRLVDRVVPAGSGRGEAGGTGAKMALDEGTMGKEASPRKSGRYAIKERYEEPSLARERARRKARTAGMLGAFASGSAFQSITGTTDFASELARVDVLGGRIGDEVGEMAGAWGYGTKNTGPGADGDGWETVGTGRYNTIGHGPDTGGGYGPGPGGGKPSKRKSNGPTLTPDPAKVSGELDKRIIRRYIRKKLPQIKHCYERQLLANPRLAGTVVTAFTISGNGAVLSVVASGLGNRNVESCIEAAVESIQFPQPEGGGLVSVRYPFTFRPGVQ